MDGSCRAFSHTLLAKLALCEIDVRNVVLDCDRLEWAYLGTLAAAYAGSLAGLACHRSLVFVDAGYVNSHIPASFVAEFDDRLRASLHAGAASRTFFFINDRKSGNRIHRDCAELTGSDTVATAKTAE